MRFTYDIVLLKKAHFNYFSATTVFHSSASAVRISFRRSVTSFECTMLLSRQISADCRFNIDRILSTAL